MICAKFRKTLRSYQTRTQHQPKQSGIVLFIVMIIVLLTSLLALWGARGSLFNEMITGNDADYQRAFEAAQAMLRDAELDITGIKANGTTAIPRCGETGATSSCRPDIQAANININNKKVYFPSSYSLDDDDGGDLLILEDKLSEFKFSTQIRGHDVGCVAAICIGGLTKIEPPQAEAPEDPNTPAAATPDDNLFWTNSSLLAYMKERGATYGQYTGAQLNSDTTTANPLLQGNAWYWVEPMLYEANLAANAASHFAPRGGGVGNSSGIVYRITAYAEGSKAGTRAILQSIYVKQVLPSDN